MDSSGFSRNGEKVVPESKTMKALDDDVGF